MKRATLYAVHGSELVALPLPKRTHELHELFVGLPLGIYSALRTYDERRFLRLEAHLGRCLLCLKRANFQLDFAMDGLCQAIDTAVRASSGGDLRLRYDFLEHPVERAGISTRVLLALAPHVPVPELVLRQGARLGLAPHGLRRPDPLIKFTDWVTERRVCEATCPDVYEHLLLDADRRILEGTSSNFYAVQNGVIVTAGDGVLEGITRQLVLELAEQCGFRVELRRLPLDELAACEEAFISSSTREVVPVCDVAGLRIGAGTPGPVVARLRQAYSAFAKAHSALAVPLALRGSFQPILPDDAS
jgi:branched-chain amino acid aminotransferase